MILEEFEFVSFCRETKYVIVCVRDKDFNRAFLASCSTHITKSLPCVECDYLHEEINWEIHNILAFNIRQGQ